MTFDVTRLQVRRTRCDHCLYGPDPIPSRARANRIRKECKEEESPFECHLGTLSGEKTRCRGWYDANQDAPIVRLAQHLGIVDFVDPQASAKTTVSDVERRRVKRMIPYKDLVAFVEEARQHLDDAWEILNDLEEDGDLPEELATVYAQLGDLTTAIRKPLQVAQ